MQMSLLLLQLNVVSVVVMVAGVAPGDEDPLCQQLRANGSAPAPSHVRVLMDSWNYHNLLPPHTGAVWTEVHIDYANNDTYDREGAVIGVRQ